MPNRSNDAPCHCRESGDSIRRLAFDPALMVSLSNHADGRATEVFDAPA
jgi:hypothetical protein